MVSTRSQRKQAAQIPLNEAVDVEPASSKVKLEDVKPDIAQDRKLSVKHESLGSDTFIPPAAAASDEVKPKSKKGKGKKRARQEDYEPSDGQDDDSDIVPAPKKSKKGKKAAAEDPNAGELGPKPSKTSSSTWRSSTIAAKKTIPKGEAMRLYRLSANDMKKLDYEAIVTNSGYDCHLYKERDVERCAWAKHGSPELFDYYINTLESRHKNQGKTGIFPCPAFRPPRRAPDPTVLPPNLVKIKEEFEEYYSQSWVFDSIWAWMDRHDRELDPAEDYPFLNKQRIEILPEAMEVIPRYPRRPSEEEMQSFQEELKDLRTALEQCPVRDVLDDPFVRNANNAHENNQMEWEWTEEFANGIKEHLTQIHRKHGINSEESLVAHWLAYQAYDQGVGSFHYDGSNWTDRAFHWLQELPAYDEHDSE